MESPREGIRGLDPRLLLQSPSCPLGRRTLCCWGNILSLSVRFPPSPRAKRSRTAARQSSYGMVSFLDRSFLDCFRLARSAKNISRSSGVSCARRFRSLSRCAFFSSRVSCWTWFGCWYFSVVDPRLVKNWSRSSGVSRASRSLIRSRRDFLSACESCGDWWLSVTTWRASVGRVSGTGVVVVVVVVTVVVVGGAFVTKRWRWCLYSPFTSFRRRSLWGFWRWMSTLKPALKAPLPLRYPFPLPLPLMELSEWSDAYSTTGRRMTSLLMYSFLGWDRLRLRKLLIRWVRLYFFHDLFNLVRFSLGLPEVL